MDLLQNSYIPHGHCYLWQTPLVWLHAASDLFTAIAYYSIPLILLYFLRKRQDIPFPKVIALFSAFILFCGTTHLLEIVTLWFPIYWISGGVKALTAMVSVITVFELIKIIPKTLELKSPQELKILNKALNNQIKEREAAELALREFNEKLEERVQARTDSLADINGQLRQEIEDRKKIQIDMEEVQYLTKKIVNISPNIIYIYDLENRQSVYSNRLVTNFLGFNSSIDSLLLENYIHPDDFPKLEESLQGLEKLDTNQYIDLEYRIQDSLSEWRWLNCRKAVFERNKDGTVKQVIASFEDITAIKEAEIKLRENQHFIERIAEASPSLLYIYDQIEECNIYSNLSVAKLLGYSVDEIQAMGADLFKTICYPDDLPKVYEGMQRIRSLETDDQVIEIEYRVVDVQGNLHWLLSRDLVFSRTEDGRVWQTIGSAQDISDRIEVEIALRESEAKFQEITLSSPNAIYIIVQDHNVQDDQDSMYFEYVSKVMEEICEISVEDLLQNFNLLVQLYHPEDLSEYHRKNHSCAETLSPFTHEWRIITPSGKLKWMKASARLVKRENGDIVRYGVISDISHRKEQEQHIYEQGRREILLREITQRIRQSLNLPTIFETLVQEIRQFLEADRVVIFQFEPNSNFEQGTIVAESVIAPFSSVLDTQITEYCFGNKYAIEYQQGKIQVIEDIYRSSRLECHINFLAQFQVRANLVFPLINNSVLWGLLCIHQCSDSRAWQETEISLLKQITHQFEIAIQQAQLYEQAQLELSEKNNLFLQLENELDQKKILLKEIHHRVKNNLQIMSSLLYLQFSKASPDIQELTEDYQSRIQSMALIHEQLYCSEDLANIDFHKYITNLTNNIFQSYSINSDLIQLHLDVINIKIPLEQSVPLGLIVHELVSNALKHAFPEGEGQIVIKLKQLGDQIHLTVKDNGIGIKSDVDLENSDSLGMQLIFSLTEQLEGESHYHFDDGSVFDMIFPIQF